MEETVNELDNAPFYRKHRYMLLIGSSISLSIVLVSISLYLYTSSGAAQLDLSRPGYSKVAKQVDNDNKDFQAFPATGDIDSETIKAFSKLFDEQSAKATEVDAFSGDPLNPDTLQISAPIN